ncbi:DNA kinase/phosphatase Pnk1 [Paramarasmius palmivorus]|uniref:DNA kinase/phosphatase Pnk1 n=1 Tax=Paramarasmius palmivorus TaxID=297713 RepID=A0AAW0CYX8_9AGAR
MSTKRTAKDADLEASGSGKQSKVAKKIHPFFSKDKQDSQHVGSFQWLKALGSKATCLHGVNLEPPSRSKVALFDLDGTIIKSSLNSKSTAWEWWRTEVPTALKKAHEEGFSIVVISNQALKPAALNTWKEKVLSIAASLPALPFRILAASAKDCYRKPMIGMWVELDRIFKEDGVEIDKAQSFFVGDAAGRQYAGGKDWASTDRKWAINVGLPFHTPEEYFLGLPVNKNYVLDGFHVSNLPELPPYTPTHTPLITGTASPEIVLFVGYPCLGKTTFFRRHFEPAKYCHVNQDTLGSRSKCVKAAEEALSKGMSCVVDNTNRDAATRKYYVQLARKMKVPIRCFLFTGQMELAWHNNLYRAYNTPPSVAAREPKRDVLPFLAFTSFKNDYEEPEESEGFSEIRKVNWVFEGDEEERQFWSMWLQL